MEDKRRAPRLNLPVKVDYRAQDKDAVSCSTLSRDISLGGIRILAPEKIAARSVLGLKIHVPDSCRPILAEGKIAWLKEAIKIGDLSGQDYELGLRFAEISGFDRARIAKLASASRRGARSVTQIALPQISKIELQDKDEILSLVKANIETQETGLKIIDQKIDLHELGSLDLLAQDISAQLVIIEVAVKKDDSMLIRALKHYDWLLRNSALLKRIYKQNIDFSQSPRIILMAPSFSGFFRQQISNLKLLQIQLLSYQCLEVNGQRGILFENLESKTQDLKGDELTEEQLPPTQQPGQLDSAAWPEAEGMDQQHQRIVHWLWKKR